MKKQTEKKQGTLCSVIKRYFTEPFEDYDGNWKGIVYYEKMRTRKEQIKFLVIMILIITGLIILNVL